MTTALLDIGSTLIDGPRIGPARRIAEALALDSSRLPEIEDLLFRTDSHGPDDLSTRISRRFGVNGGIALEVCKTLWDAQLREAFVIPGAREAIANLKSA